MGDLDVIIEDKFGSKIVRWSTWRHISPGWNQGVVPLPPSAEVVLFHIYTEMKDNYYKITIHNYYPLYVNALTK